MKQPRRLVPAGFFVLRTPLLPVRALREATEGASSLRAILDEPAVREAIAIASPTLAARIDAGDVDAMPALLRYVQRMAARATPFGLFAGISTGSVSGETSLVIDDAAIRRVRLDMGAVLTLASALERDPVVRREVRFRPNSACVTVGERLILPERVAHGSSHVFSTVAVDADEAVRRVLARARGGALHHELAESVRDLAGSEEDALSFVDELVDGHLLVSELVPPLTGGDPLACLARALPPDGVAADAVAHIRRELAALDGGIADDNRAACDAYARAADASSAVCPEVGRSHLFQIDMVRRARATLGKDVTDAIAEGIEILHALGSDEDDLAGFVRAFSERFGEREVPLAVALDEDFGVGFPGHASFTEPVPLLRGLELARGSETATPTTPIAPVLLRKLEAAWRDGAESLSLSWDDFGERKRPRRPLPPSLAAHVTLLARDRASGRHRVLLHSWSGPSGSRLLGRFCPWDDDLTARLRAHLAEEQATYGDALLAEVVHLPADARTGNIALRPALRDYEIAYGARSGLAAERTLDVDDLVVSVVGDRVVLRSRRLGREIVPRLSCAHAVGPSDAPIYRFLVALQSQGFASVGAFEWGAYRDARSLPRVVHGDVILSPRQWTITKSELADLARLRRELSLPRDVGLVDGDNVLPVDLDREDSLHALVRVVAKVGHARLVELFVDESDTAVRGARGGYANEIVVPFATQNVPPAVVSARARTADARARRTYAPGSEWLYLKLYAGASTLEPLLVDVVRPLVDRARASGRVDRWFFIRYEDPNPHLRVRFHGDPAYLTGELLAFATVALDRRIDDGVVRRFEIATYDRELERYGGWAGIDLAEQLFEADSDAALASVELLRDRPEGCVRWALALHGMHTLLDDFGLTLPARAALVGEIHSGFSAEHSAGKATERALDARYRKERAMIASLLDVERAPSPFRTLFERRSAIVRPIARELHGRLVDGRIPRSMEEILDAFLHMANNRLLKFPARPQELALSGLLVRAYASLAARARRTSTTELRAPTSLVHHGSLAPR